MTTPSARPMPLPSDEDLVRAAQAGDGVALEQLAERWWPEMRRWALVDLADEALADDAAQDALVRLIRGIGSCDPERPFRPWLRRVVRNCSHDVQARSARVFRLPPESGDATRDLERETDLGRVAARAVEAFAALSTRQRQVFDLCDRQGLDATEAAEALEIAPGTVRVLLHRARQALRERMLAHRAEILELLREP